MIRGRISSQGAPFVPLTVHGSRKRRIEAVLDTGFTGHLCVARRHRRWMHLNPVGEVETELADGSRTMQRMYVGHITFGGVKRQIFVTLTRASDSLMGTALLLDKQVRLDFRRRQLSVF
jgi:predicted aspartyl protease